MSRSMIPRTASSFLLSRSMLTACITLFLEWAIIILTFSLSVNFP